MKKVFVIFISIFMFANLSFATDPDISVNDAGSNMCVYDVLDKYSGTAGLKARWEANNIDLYWYDNGTQLNVPSTSASCDYGSNIAIPTSSVPSRPGYTFKGWKLRGLPDGYTKLKYIESSGGQQINTGIFSGGIGLKTKLTLELTTSITSESAIVGIQDQCSFYEIYFRPYGIGAYHAPGQQTYISTPNRNHTSGLLYTIVSEMTSNSITLNVNGVQESYSGTVQNAPDGNHQVTLFRLCNSYAISARLYSAQIWKNGSLVRNFIPAKNSSNVAGLYDMVSNTFFTSSTATPFIAGPTASQ